MLGQVSVTSPAEINSLSEQKQHSPNELAGDALQLYSSPARAFLNHAVGAQA